MIAVTSPGRAVNDTPDSAGSSAPGILERHVLEFDRARMDGGRLALRSLGDGGIVDVGDHVEHLVDALGRRGGARQHDEHRRDHEHGKEDLDGVLERRHHRADVHLAGVDAHGAEPDDQDAGQVHHEEHRGHQQRDQAVDGDRRAGDIEIGRVEPAALVRAAIEGADHADARQAFVEHEVEPIDLDLHQLIERHRLPHDQEEDDRQDRDHRDQHARQPRVLRERQRHAADRHHRRRDRHARAASAARSAPAWCRWSCG